MQTLTQSDRLLYVMIPRNRHIINDDNQQSIPIANDIMCIVRA